ncbi:hypothetical protein LCGC14_3142130 [marine sediment metagenome]|uniref:Uncharacterized protein n=1 Tax=marine sediment metagenome TaxID=412755 RepID=A0A0F8VWG7_9ZZZZ
MKVTRIETSKIPPRRRGKNSRYDEVWETANRLAVGYSLKIELRSRSKVNNMACAARFAKIRKKLLPSVVLVQRGSVAYLVKTH